MIIVLGTFVFRKPISDDVRARLGELAQAVRERHAGNFDYRLSIDTGDARVLRLMERWDELQSFVKHGATPEVAALVALVNSDTTESTEIMRYEIASETRV